MADPAQFEQLLMNLVVNARDAMPGGGVIRINAQLHSPNAAEPMHVPHSAGWVGISVCDEGCGISPEMLGRIFEPFFTTKAPGQGTGLGLATCAMILERSGGWIDCQSQLGKGTTFTFYLPCAEEALEIQTARPEIPCATNQQTILVVEDEPTVGEVVAMLLGNLGYNVISAENGEIAERIVAERGSEIDLVLTDLNMPRMNGRELVQRLREINPRVQVILTSGNNPAHDQPSAQPLEFDFLPKPFRQQDLALKVHQVLER
jgi:CheY-like chemotaxis protein